MTNAETNCEVTSWPNKYSEEGRLGGAIAPQTPPRRTKCNSSPISGQCTNHVFLYNSPFLCGFNVSKGLKEAAMHFGHTPTCPTIQLSEGSATSKTTIDPSKISNINNANIPRLMGWIGSEVRVNASFHYARSDK